jgi:WD40 repeat protein
MRRCIVYLLVVSTMILISHAIFAQSDDSNLPWCRQPSEVGIENQSRSYTWVTQLGHGPDGIRPIYQEYNHRIILMTSNTRDVVQIIEEGIDTNGFELLGYSSDCRYIAAALGARGERIETVVWDLSTNPAVRLGLFGDGVSDSHRLDWSPDGQYVIVSTRNSAYLWNLATNTQTELVADVVSDCYRSPIGCNGRLYSHSGLEWDIANSIVHVNLNRVGYTVTFDLNTGQAVGYTDRIGEPITQEETETVEARVESPYGCVPRVQYQTYNQQLVLRDWITGELIEVIENQLNLVGFQNQGWSATCQYIAATIDAGSGLELVAWNIATHSRTSVSVADYVDRLEWSPVGNVALVQTDGDGAFLWNIDSNQKTIIGTPVAGSPSVLQSRWLADRNLLLVITASSPTTVFAYDISSGQEAGTFDNPAEGYVGFGSAYNLARADQWLVVWSSVRDMVSPIFSLWNLDTRAVLRLTSTTGHPGVSLSPTGRYLYSVPYSRYGYPYGYAEIWDIQHPEGTEPYAPVSVLDFGETWGIKFIDEHTVETYTSDATQFEISRCIAYRTAYRWDIRTGELLSETPILRDGC